MKKRYVVALDQGTTSSRAILFNRQGQIESVAQHPFRQIYPKSGWVEQDPKDIRSSQLAALTEVLVSHGVRPAEIDSIGITNQRETTIIWDRETGEPIANAIVWQCRRTADMVAEIAGPAEVSARITATTGLVPDAYFSASKIKWLLDNTPGAREAAKQGRLAFGTVDSWLLWSLTYGRVHATDVTNASRTMLYNIHEGRWDPWLLELFDVPAALLPEVRPSASYFGETENPGIVGGVPLAGMAGDQQSALFGQCCFERGQAKNTYGTGCFLLMHTGTEACVSQNKLLTTVAASAPGIQATEYALEGSVFVAGALIQWLRDELGIIKTSKETAALARSVPDTGGVYVVPAFTGLGAPYWDPDARGSIMGLTRGTSRAQFVRACLEALAYQVHDLVRAMEADAGVQLDQLNVDGGASMNDFLMQFQSDILLRPLRRPQNIETTALGAAFLAGLTTGFWKDVSEIYKNRSADAAFSPTMSEVKREEFLSGWRWALGRTLSR